MTADRTEWSCPNTGRTCTAEDCGKECFQGAAEGDECAASGQSCNYGPHGPNGETQCRYCGEAKPQPKHTLPPAPVPEAQPIKRRLSDSEARNLIPFQTTSSNWYMTGFRAAEEYYVGTDQTSAPVDGETTRLRQALKFYADGDHFTRHRPEWWDTVSGEPQNFYEDEAGTATVEDGSVAKAALEDAELQDENGLPIAAAFNALRELVACKDMKERAEALHFAGPLSELGEGWKAEYDRLRAEYIRRQPAAWEVARDLLKSPSAVQAPAVQDGVRELMSMTEEQIDDELRALGIDPATAAQKGGEAVASALQRSGGYACGICGKATPHQHTPEDVVIFRNGVKRGAGQPPRIEQGAKVRQLAAHLHELRDLLDRRPAMNVGLIEAYAKWNGEVYALDWLNNLDAITSHPPVQHTATQQGEN